MSSGHSDRQGAALISVMVISACVVLALAAVALIVLPLRTLTQLRLVVSSASGAVDSCDLELLDADGAVIKRDKLTRLSRRSFSYGDVRAVRISATGCAANTVKLEGCDETLHFTDFHTRLHHGSASRYERVCEVRAQLDCP